MEQKIKSGVYIITCHYNRKTYVGSSKNCNYRIYEHRRQLKNNKHRCIDLQNDFNEFDSNMFSFNIIEFTENFKEKESFWINHYKSTETEFGYNVLIPGESLKYEDKYNKYKCPHKKSIIVIDIKTNQAKEYESLYQFSKIKNLNKQRLDEIVKYWIKKGNKKTYLNWIIIHKEIYDPTFDYINFKYERKKQTKKAKEEIIKTNKRKRKVRAINKETGEIREFESISELTRELKMVSSKVSYCLSGIKKSHHGYKIEYV